MKRIDLNCDMGELPEAIADGTQEALMPFLTSVNIACGGHAGDAEMMRATIRQAKRLAVAVGAHPGYADRANFGRVALKLSSEAVAEFVYEQLRALGEIATDCGVPVAHVKPHGALYNESAKNPALAKAIATGINHWIAGIQQEVPVFTLAGSPTVREFQKCGLQTVEEAFADRRYESNGTLRSRTHEDALIKDPAEAAKQALRIAQSGTVIAHDGREIAVKAQTICIHGDTPGPLQIAQAVAKALRSAGVRLKAVGVP